MSARENVAGLNETVLDSVHLDILQIVAPAVVSPISAGNESILMNPRPNPDVPAVVMQHVTIAWQFFRQTNAARYPPVNLRTMFANLLLIASILTESSPLVGLTRRSPNVIKQRFV